MKNCFKTVLAAVAVLVWLGASAQDDPSKETVIINPFTHTSAVSQAACDNIRAAVLSGFADRGRFHIVDALTDGTLSKLYADRNVEDVVNDANSKAKPPTRRWVPGRSSSDRPTTFRSRSSSRISTARCTTRPR